MLDMHDGSIADVGRSLDTMICTRDSEKAIEFSPVKLNGCSVKGIQLVNNATASSFDYPCGVVVCHLCRLYTYI